jgi:hypothetical protein
MAELTEQEFSKHLNSKFDVKRDDQQLQLELFEVKVYRPHEHEQPGMERFSAYFSGPSDHLLPQGVYSLSHEQMGDFDLFLVPLAADQRGCRYEAVFNYHSGQA